MKLYEKYAAIRDKFEVLAFHDASVKDFEELDEKLAQVSEKRWDGKTLPFPILLDPSKTTIRAYGISAYPTNVLIDPDGKVVKGNAEKNLEKELEKLAPPEPEEKPKPEKDAEKKPEPAEKPQEPGKSKDP